MDSSSTQSANDSYKKCEVQCSREGRGFVVRIYSEDALVTTCRGSCQVQIGHFQVSMEIPSPISINLVELQQLFSLVTLFTATCPQSFGENTLWTLQVGGMVGGLLEAGGF